MIYRTHLRAIVAQWLYNNNTPVDPNALLSMVGMEYTEEDEIRSKTGILVGQNLLVYTNSVQDGEERTNFEVTPTAQGLFEALRSGS